MHCTSGFRRTSLPSQQANAMDHYLASYLRRQQQVKELDWVGKDRRGTKERNSEPERALCKKERLGNDMKEIRMMGGKEGGIQSKIG